eukprot:364918-Chlamydomonas_euryale.AAC.10
MNRSCSLAATLGRCPGSCTPLPSLASEARLPNDPPHWMRQTTLKYVGCLPQTFNSGPGDHTDRLLLPTHNCLQSVFPH